MIPYSGEVFFGNTVLEYVYALALFVGLFIVFKIFHSVVLSHANKLAKKTETDVDDTVIRIIKTLRPPFYVFLAFFFSVQMLEFHSILDSIIFGILVFWLVAQIVVAMQILVEYLIRKRVDVDNNEHTEAALGVVNVLIKIALWTIGLLLILSNLGVNITSLVAGLGIGGVAIAFALQNILSDLFSSFAIYFDKPFEVGDFIVVEGKSGTVEKIGIKTTRVRALQGEELVFANQKLTSADIQNFKRMDERRIVFSIGLTYDTPSKSLKEVPKIIEEVISNVENVRFDRAHFKSFSTSSLDFEIVYFVQSDDYNEYMNAQQSINMAIKEKFDKEGIDMAFPTQTVYLKK